VHRSFRWFSTRHTIDFDFLKALDRALYHCLTRRMVLLPDVNGSNESFSEFLVRSQRTMAAGGIAGCVAKTIMAPLSRLTILFQVGPMLSAVKMNGVVAVNNEFSGSLYSVGKRVLKEEGFLSFWKGNLTSVIHRFPYSAINFTVYDRLRTSFRNLNYGESPFTRFICGASAGGTACFACYPLDLVRTRLTVLKTPGSSSIYGSISSTMLSIMKNEGFLGLYRGVFVSVCVTTPTFGISFCVYGTVKEKLLKINSSYNIFKDSSSEKLSAYGSMLCGALSGITSSLIMFPADSLRRRMQVAGFLLNNSASNNCASINTNTTSSKPCSSSSSSSSSVGDSSNLIRNESITKPQRFFINSELFKVLKGDGYRGLYRGIVPEILKVTPMVSITFCVYEFTYDLLNP
jgi:solute carrier family 25 (mitochondrial phosphate transporter), member 23/24/25/41